MLWGLCVVADGRADTLLCAVWWVGMRASRVNYCHLWKALITHNVEQIAEYSKRLGVEEYQLFSSMLTARDWNSYGPHPCLCVRQRW